MQNTYSLNTLPGYAYTLNVSFSSALILPMLRLLFSPIMLALAKYFQMSMDVSWVQSLLACFCFILF